MPRLRSLTADLGLRRPQQLRWIVENTAAAIAGELGGAELQVVSPSAIARGELRYEEASGRASVESSPARLLAVDLTLRVCGLANERGVPARVLDLGCGSGGFLPFFREQLERFASYTGVDATPQPSWETLRTPNARFVQEPAETFVDTLARDDYTLVYSNSALEHIEGDAHVVETLGRWAHGRDVLQLHVVPASAALPLYRLHGYRVYTRADIARIARAFAPADVSIVALGGRASWTLHLLHLRDRTSKPDEYASRLLEACRRDVVSAPRFPIMWALVVRSSSNA